MIGSGKESDASRLARPEERDKKLSPALYISAHQSLLRASEAPTEPIVISTNASWPLLDVSAAPASLESEALTTRPLQLVRY